MSDTATASATATASDSGPANVNVSAMSAYANAYSWTTLCIGANYVPFNPPQNAACYWLVVVDLTNLSVVLNTTTNSVTVPPAIQQYVGNPRYFLFCISNVEMGYNYPHGPFYAFLQQVGSGPQLARAEQIISQLGTATIANLSYILAATMDTNDLPGYEVFSSTGPVLFAMQFMPVNVGGQITYAPINPFGP